MREKYWKCWKINVDKPIYMWYNSIMRVEKGECELKKLLIAIIVFAIIIGIMVKIECSKVTEPIVVVEYVYITKYVDKPTEQVEQVVEDNYNEEDLYWLSRIISTEAKGENVKGQIAVGNVVMNRVMSDKYPNTIKEVIFQKNQFSPTINGSIYDEPTESAIESAKKVLDGEVVVDSEVLFFYNPKVVSRGSWVRTRATVEDIGNHRFAK